MPKIDIQVPDIGDFKDVAVIELLVKPGDSVKAEQSLITVESDKASMEIPSSHAGIVKELKLKVGDVVNQGTVMLSLEVLPLWQAVPLQLLKIRCPSAEVRKNDELVHRLWFERKVNELFIFVK